MQIKRRERKLHPKNINFLILTKWHRVIKYDEQLMNVIIRTLSEMVNKNKDPSNFPTFYVFPTMWSSH